MNSLSGEEIRRLRLERGLSQNQLSEAAGLGGQSVVSNIERGLAPGADVERRLREALGLLVDGAVGASQKVTVTTDGE